MQTPRLRTSDVALGRWPGILTALEVDPKFLTGKHGPCPFCGGEDRFRFDDKGGRGSWICSQCGAGDGFSLLSRLFGWDFKWTANEVDRVVNTITAEVVKQVQTDDAKVAALGKVWQSASDLSMDDAAGRYLNRRLGINTPPKGLRFHSGMKYSNGKVYPAMLALMRYPDGKAASIHRTYLTEDGQKAPVDEVRKFMPGLLLKSSSVRLCTPGPTLGIAEGIETALAASKRFGMPFWAACNATLLESWVPPTGVTRVLIAGDNDQSYRGQAAAFSLAQRLNREGFAVEVLIPRNSGTDWAGHEA